MQLFTLTKQNSMHTFSGADADPRFARDDVGGELILRERDLHPLAPQTNQDDDMPEPTMPPNVPDGDDDQNNDFRSM